ncbi:MAG: 4-alpha-glucanotransferase [Acidimicrobiia bacterium]
MRNGRSDGWGIDHGYHATDGTWQETTEETRTKLRRAMGGDPSDERAPDRPPVWTVPQGWGESLQSPCRLLLEDGREYGVVDSLPADLPIGRHQLVPVDDGPTTLLIVRPRHCHHADGMRLAALAVQAYAARSSRSWGIGDLRDLRDLGGWARRHGVDLLALSPLHAPSLGDVPASSPYYPSSRRHLNPLHLAIEEVPGAADDGEVARLGAEARGLLSERRIDRGAVWQAKRAALEHLYGSMGSAGHEELDRFIADRGVDLRRFATFAAIFEHHQSAWWDWPVELQHPGAAGVGRFADEHADRIRFHCWVQLLCDRQLRSLADVCPVMTDLAVGVDPGGADAWVDQDLLALDARVGAPPDDFAADGQDWGLPPYIPHRMVQDRYETFAKTVRAALRHGAGIRMDHVLGLFRLFWIPTDGSPADGAYVRYPADDLLAVLAIESERAGAFVIGEDLGTVEEGVRESLADEKLLGTRVVYFEDDVPSTWPAGVAGAATTHDLPTIAGTWNRADARLREEAGLSADGTDALRASLERVVGRDDAPARDAIVAVHEALAASPVELAIGNLDDVLCTEERPNMPGTVDEWPNWSIAQPVTVDELTAGDPPDTLTSLRRTPS